MGARPAGKWPGRVGPRSGRGPRTAAPQARGGRCAPGADLGHRPTWPAGRSVGRRGAGSVGVGRSLTGEEPAMAWVDYDQLAAVYDQDRAVPLEALEPWRTALAAYLPPASGLPVLDLGAGTGLFSVAIAQWFDTAVIALEPSEAMRNQARSTRVDPRVAYVGGLGEDLPLRGGCCDSAWLSTVIHHLSDLAGCAGELRRVVRPGGWVLIRQAFPDRPEPGTRLFTFWPGARAILARAPTLQATRATFAAAGFRFHRLEQI